MASGQPDFLAAASSLSSLPLLWHEVEQAARTVNHSRQLPPAQRVDLTV